MAHDIYWSVPGLQLAHPAVARLLLRPVSGVAAGRRQQADRLREFLQRTLPDDPGRLESVTRCTSHSPTSPRMAIRSAAGAVLFVIRCIHREADDYLVVSHVDVLVGVRRVDPAHIAQLPPGPSDTATSATHASERPRRMEELLPSRYYRTVTGWMTRAPVASTSTRPEQTGYGSWRTCDEESWPFGGGVGV